jgi:hypothetical protein
MTQPPLTTFSATAPTHRCQLLLLLQTCRLHPSPLLFLLPPLMWLLGLGIDLLVAVVQLSTPFTLIKHTNKC